MTTGSTIIAAPQKVNRVKPFNYKEADQSFFSDGFTYETFAVSKNSYTNILATEYAIYDRNRVVKTSLANPVHFTRMQYRYLLQHRLFHKKVLLSASENHLFVSDYWSNSHYHFFCDLLPKLYCLKDELRHYTLLLPAGSYIKNNAVNILTMAGLLPGNIIFMDANKYYKAPSLTAVTHVSPSGTTHPDIMSAIKESIRAASGNDGNGAVKLYVSREKARYRKLLNETAVQECFKNFGYSIVRFEDHSLAEQIALSSNLRIMAGLHGAGFTNALFMPSQSHVLEFRRNGIHHNHCYWDIANSTALHYNYLFGKPDSKMPIEGNGCNLTIDIPQLEALLQDLEKNI